MIAVYDENGERLSREKIEFIVENEGKWVGISEERPRDLYFDYMIEKYDIGLYRVCVKSDRTRLYSDGIESFTGAYFTLNALDNSMYIFFYGNIHDSDEPELGNVVNRKKT